MNYPQNRDYLYTAWFSIHGISDRKREVTDRFFVSTMDAPRSAGRHLAQVISDSSNAISDTACGDRAVGGNVCNLTLDIFKGIE